MKQSILKKFLCVVSLVLLACLAGAPAYAEGADTFPAITTPAANDIFLRATISKSTPQAGETVTVTVSMYTTAEASLTSFQVSLNGISSDVLYVVDCKPLLPAATGETSSASGQCYNLGDEVRFIYKGSEGISAPVETKLMEVTFRINPDLATDGSIPLYLWYIKDGEKNGTLAGTVTIPYTVTATGEGYYVFLNANGGTLSADALQTNSEGRLSALPTPTREGYVFDGWYTAISGGEKVTSQTAFSQDTNIYAHWTIDTAQEENGEEGGTMGDAVTLGIAGSIISVFIYLLILLLI